MKWDKAKTPIAKLSTEGTVQNVSLATSQKMELAHKQVPYAKHLTHILENVQAAMVDTKRSEVLAKLPLQRIQTVKNLILQILIIVLSVMEVFWPSMESVKRSTLYAKLSIKKMDNAALVGKDMSLLMAIAKFNKQQVIAPSKQSKTFIV